MNVRIVFAILLICILSSAIAGRRGGRGGGRRGGRGQGRGGSSKPKPNKPSKPSYCDGGDLYTYTRTVTAQLAVTEDACTKVNTTSVFFRSKDKQLRGANYGPSMTLYDFTDSTLTVVLRRYAGGPCIVFTPSVQRTFAELEAELSSRNSSSVVANNSLILDTATVEPLNSTDTEAFRNRSEPLRQFCKRTVVQAPAISAVPADSRTMEVLSLDDSVTLVLPPRTFGRGSGRRGKKN